MTSATTPKVVFLSCDEMGVQIELPAAGAITPGMLVERTSAGTVQAHGSAGATAQLAFADIEWTSGGSISDAYAALDRVIYKILPAGASVYALVPAAEAAIAVGDYLTSNGDGTLTAATDGDIIVAQAIEAVDNSGGASPARITIETVAPQAQNPAAAA